MLVTLQVAMSLVLLTGAVLFVRTLGNLRSMDAGFDYHMVKPVDYDELLRLLGTSPVPRQANLA